MGNCHSEQKKIAKLQGAAPVAAQVEAKRCSRLDSTTYDIEAKIKDALLALELLKNSEPCELWVYASSPLTTKRLTDDAYSPRPGVHEMGTVRISLSEFVASYPTLVTLSLTDIKASVNLSGVLNLTTLGELDAGTKTLCQVLGETQYELYSLGLNISKQEKEIAYEYCSY
jgi:hypothetical protein